MRFAVLLAAAVLCGCQPTQTQGQAPFQAAPAQAVPSPLAAPQQAWTEAHAYMADVRAALNVAFLSDRETTPLGDCDSPRFEPIPWPRTLEVRQCRLSITSGTDYRVEARFSNGQSWVADAAGIRQVEPGTLRLLN